MEKINNIFIMSTLENKRQKPSQDILNNTKLKYKLNIVQNFQHVKIQAFKKQMLKKNPECELNCKKIQRTSNKYLVYQPHDQAII